MRERMARHPPSGGGPGNPPRGADQPDQHHAAPAITPEHDLRPSCKAGVAGSNPTGGSMVNPRSCLRPDLTEQLGSPNQGHAPTLRPDAEWVDVSLLRPTTSASGMSTTIPMNIGDASSSPIFGR